MSCNWFPHCFSEHNVNCTVPQIWTCSELFEMTHSRRLQVVSGRCIQRGMQQEQGPVLVEGGGKTGMRLERPNHRIWAQGFLAGSRVWNLQNFLCWLYSCLCACTAVLSDSSCERRLEGCMEGVEEFRCQYFASICTKYHNADKTAELVGDNDFSFSDRTSVTLFFGWLHCSSFPFLPIIFVTLLAKLKVQKKREKQFETSFKSVISPKFGVVRIKKKKEHKQK